MRERERERDGGVKNPVIESVRWKHAPISDIIYERPTSLSLYLSHSSLHPTLSLTHFLKLSLSITFCLISVRTSWSVVVHFIEWDIRILLFDWTYARLNIVIVVVVVVVVVVVTLFLQNYFVTLKRISLVQLLPLDILTPHH